MIPKKLHFVWVGNRPLPSNAKCILKAWEQLHPSWEINLWKDAEVALARDSGMLQASSEFWNAYDTHENPGIRGDMLRYLILMNLGGVYADVSDMQPLKPIDDLVLHLSAFAGTQVVKPDPMWLETAILGCTPRHKYFVTLVDKVAESIRNKPNLTPIDQTGPGFLSEVHRELRDTSYTQSECITVFEPKYFYPIPHNEREKAKGNFPGSYTVHQWLGTWID